MKNKSLKQLIRKMYMPRLVIPIVLLVVLATVFIINPFSTHIDPTTIKDLSTIDKLYSKENYNVSYNAQTLYYTGVDYTESGKIKAHIYYTLEEGHCYFFVICHDEIKNIPSTITKYNIKAHLTHNDNMYEAVIASMSEELEFSKDSLQDVCSPIFINQYDYSHSFETISLYVLLIFTAMVIVDIIFIIIVFVQPQISIPFFRMRKYGKLKRLYIKASHEFNTDVINFGNKVYLSDSFIYGITYADNIEIVLLEHIVWIYKNKNYTAKRNKEEITCTLCLVTDQKQLIKIAQVPEDICDLVIHKVQTRFPQVMAENE